MSLMLSVKEGQVENLGILFERHKVTLYGYFFRSTLNKDLSEDLVQTVFFKILKNRSKFDGYGKFTTWMYHIAHNVYIDHFRKNKKFRQSEDIETLEIGTHSSADNMLIREEEIQNLQEALKMLPPDKKEILLLSKYQGLKYKEIGEILDCTENAVKVRVFRALNQLKEIYIKLEGNSDEI